MANFVLNNIPCIQINGHGFTLKMSEADMLERSQELQSMADALTKMEKPTTQDVLRTCRAVERYINDLCGENAMHTMVDGLPMSVVDTVRLLGVVNGEASMAFGAALADKHA